MRLKSSARSRFEVKLSFQLSLTHYEVSNFLDNDTKSGLLSKTAFLLNECYQIGSLTRGGII